MSLSGIYSSLRWSVASFVPFAFRLAGLQDDGSETTRRACRGTTSSLSHTHIFLHYNPTQVPLQQFLPLTVISFLVEPAVHV